MATAVIMPRQGQSVESCIITKWHKQVGDKVNIGDLLFSYETDKSTFEEAAKVEGELLAIFFEEGDDVECLVNVCVIGDKGEDISAFKPDIPPAINSIASQQSINEKLKISPRAIRMAEKNGISLNNITGTGPGGRIIARDIQAIIYAGQTQQVKGVEIGIAEFPFEIPKNQQAGWEIIPLSTIRKTISKVMHKSLQNSAQLTLNTSFDATDIFEFRKKAKQTFGDSGTPIVSINDIIIYVTSRVLLKHKSLNAHYLDDDTMKVFNATNIALAVDTPRGLMVPVIFNASGMGLSFIAMESKRLQGLCVSGTISPDLLQGASFTISNLGTMGVEAFTPILNPPQTGILGVCSTIERLRNGQSYPAMGLSLTYDHRALDGADAARFLKDLVNYLENFTVFTIFNREEK